MKTNKEDSISGELDTSKTLTLGGRPMNPSKSNHSIHRATNEDCQQAIDALLDNFGPRHRPEDDSGTTEETDYLHDIAQEERGIERLRIMGDMFHASIQNRIASETNRILELSQMVPSLLSLNKDSLREILGYLDEEGLYDLEESTFLQIDESVLRERWEQLDSKQLYKSAVETSARDRGRRFARAAKFTRLMEQSADIHYNDLTKKEGEDYEWPSQFYSVENFVRDFRPGRELYHDVDFFVRLTYQEDSGESTVLAEGFRSKFVDEDNMDEDDIPLLGVHYHGSVGMEEDEDDDDDPRMIVFYFPNLASDIGEDKLGADLKKDFFFDDEMWPEEQMRTFLERTSVTVTACRTDNDDFSLVTATKGYSKSDQDTPKLVPRSKNPKDRGTALDTRDCVNVGIFLIRNQNMIGYVFCVPVEWGNILASMWESF